MLTKLALALTLRLALITITVMPSPCPWQDDIWGIHHNLYVSLDSVLKHWDHKAWLQNATMASRLSWAKYAFCHTRMKYIYQSACEEFYKASNSWSWFSIRKLRTSITPMSMMKIPYIAMQGNWYKQFTPLLPCSLYTLGK